MKTKSLTLRQALLILELSCLVWSSSTTGAVLSGTGESDKSGDLMYDVEIYHPGGFAKKKALKTKLSFLDIDFGADTGAAAALTALQTSENECVVKEYQFSSCVYASMSEEDYRACASCIINSFPVDPKECYDLKSYLCQAPVDCPCTPCAAELQARQKCQSGCFATCPDDPAEITCDDLYNEVVQCLDTQLTPADKDACMTCVNDGGPNGLPDPFFCEVARPNICTDPALCGCGPTCSDLYSEYLQCRIWCDVGDCSVSCKIPMKRCRRDDQCCSLKCKQVGKRRFPTCR